MLQVPSPTVVEEASETATERSQRRPGSSLPLYIETPARRVLKPIRYLMRNQHLSNQNLRQHLNPLILPSQSLNPRTGPEPEPQPMPVP